MYNDMMKSDSMNSMNYNDSAVAVRCASGMKPCDGRCIPGNAMCHSDQQMAPKKKGGNIAAKVAFAAGGLGAAALGIRNRKEIGKAVDGVRNTVQNRREIAKPYNDEVRERNQDLKEARNERGTMSKTRAQAAKTAEKKAKDGRDYFQREKKEALKDAPSITGSVLKGAKDVARGTYQNAKKDISGLFGRNKDKDK